MRNDFHEDDPKAIWQNQSTEKSNVSLILIRQKARQLQRRTRRELSTSLAALVAIFLFFVFSIENFPQLRQMLYAMFACVFAWDLAGLYFLNRGKRPDAMPANAGFSTGLEFCRQEIERQRDYSRRLLLWSFGPLTLAIGTFLLAFALALGSQFFTKAMPVTILVVLWVAAYLMLRLRQQRELQREIDELRDIESENSRRTT